MESMNSLSETKPSDHNNALTLTHSGTLCIEIFDPWPCNGMIPLFIMYSSEVSMLFFGDIPFAHHLAFDLTHGGISFCPVLS